MIELINIRTYIAVHWIICPNSGYFRAAGADHLHALRTRPSDEVATNLGIDLLALMRQIQTTPPADLTELQRALASLSMIHANALTRLADHGAAIRW